MLNGIQRYAEWTNHPNVEDLELMRLAVIDSNQDHVFNAIEKLIWDKKYKSEHLQIFLQYLYSGIKNRFNPERCIHFMYEYFNTEQDPYFGMLMGAFKEAPEVNIVDAHSNYQVESKTWLIDNLVKLNRRFEDAVFIGGWLGISTFWTHKRNIVHHITNIDMDPEAIKFSNKLNQFNNTYSGLVEDAYDYDYDKHDLVINTSAEHMTEEWFNKIKPGTVVAIQTNDFHEIDEHINTVNDLTELQEKYIMSEILFVGTKDCDRYNRFMLIGIK
jgi:2-polyprenyl-3-methyl-5-hydroxy-6-metoxy-1,4-benzoquinol methylase